MKSVQVWTLTLWTLAATGAVRILRARADPSPPPSGGALYPKDSETREVRKLDGIWNFRVSPVDPETGFKNFWYKYDLSKTGPVIPMPVPSSYNDVTQDISIRDHVGLVWYDRRFFVPDTWRKAESRVWLRFSSVHYAAQVWINGNLVMHHEIGHLPFEKEVTKYLNFGVENRVTVACDNTLLKDTVPQGSVIEVPTDDGIKLKQTYTFDFFNYAGIHRSVFLYTTPNLYIDDVIVNTHIQGKTGIIVYNVSYGGYNANQDVFCYINILDQNETVIAHSVGFGGTIEIPNANFWWPYLMHPEPGYLYTMEVHLATESITVADIYRLNVGIRTVTWSNTTLYINDKPAYLKGFGRHEDSDLRGKGLDMVLATKDYNLIRWVGANTYRTSHYPYAEELYDFADQQGIMIIDECPSVDTDLFSSPLLVKHMDSLTELVKRDKNHPSVIMWSIANEPRTQLVLSGEYFGKVANHVRSMDTSRPITIALARAYNEDKAGKHLDIISFNRYNGWYSNPGNLDMITDRVIAEATAWHQKYNKPVLMSEYGADTMPGLHLHPEFIWSEEYQVELMSKHFKAFDALRDMGFFIGEFIWNFADFKTEQSVTRVGGNKKGIFTRDRQPKASAHHLRRRYHLLAQEIDGVSPPKDLLPYMVKSPANVAKEEL
ncbi:beta-glucuronidase isoform X2 [Arctopsyche grandis]|uniref:beta-glucuronidase isoform X2 n=1 Tax=Arctopsyche grandis TaxID=121162 RepID=UPI00406D6BAA